LVTTAIGLVLVIFGVAMREPVTTTSSTTGADASAAGVVWATALPAPNKLALMSIATRSRAVAAPGALSHAPHRHKAAFIALISPSLNWS
jgi:hypothetical protein